MSVVATLEHVESSNLRRVATLRSSSLRSILGHDELSTDTNLRNQALFLHFFGSNPEPKTPGGSTDTRLYFRYDLKPNITM